MSKGKPRHNPDKPQNKIGVDLLKIFLTQTTYIVRLDMTLVFAKAIRINARRLGIDRKLEEAIVERI